MGNTAANHIVVVLHTEEIDLIDFCHLIEDGVRESGHDRISENSLINFPCDEME